MYNNFSSAIAKSFDLKVIFQSQIWYSWLTYLKAVICKTNLAEVYNNFGSAIAKSLNLRFTFQITVYSQ